MRSGKWSVPILTSNQRYGTPNIYRFTTSGVALNFFLLYLRRPKVSAALILNKSDG